MGYIVINYQVSKGQRDIQYFSRKLIQKLQLYFQVGKHYIIIYIFRDVKQTHAVCVYILAQTTEEDKQ